MESTRAGRAKKRYARINVGLLYNAIMHEGGISQAAARWRTSDAAINSLLKGEIPRLDSLKRILTGAKLAADQLILGPAAAPTKASMHEFPDKGGRRSWS